MGKESSKRSSRTRSRSRTKHATKEKSDRRRKKNHKQCLTKIRIPEQETAAPPAAPKKKSVSFFETIRIQEIFGLHELSSDEIGQVWYSPEEIRRIRRLHSKLQKSLREMPAADREILMNVYCIQQPSKRKTTKDERHIRIATCRVSVLVQQERLWEEEIEKALKATKRTGTSFVGAPIADPLEIAATSLALSKEAREEATERGLEVCQQVIDDLRRELISTSNTTNPKKNTSNNRLVQQWLWQSFLHRRQGLSESGKNEQETPAAAQEKDMNFMKGGSQQHRRGSLGGMNKNTNKRSERRAGDETVKKMLLLEEQEDLTSATEDESESSLSSISSTDHGDTKKVSSGARPRVSSRRVVEHAKGAVDKQDDPQEQHDTKKLNVVRGSNKQQTKTTRTSQSPGGQRRRVTGGLRLRRHSIRL